MNARMRWSCSAITSLLLLLFAPSVSADERRRLVTTERGILGTATERSASLSFGDLDGDSDLDIVVANGRHWPADNRIFLNSGDGRFRRMRLLGGDALTSYAAALGDLDGDGDLDIVVGNDREPNQIFLNGGVGAFEPSMLLAGVSDEPPPTRSIHLADFDNDRDLDVLVVNRGRANVLYINDGAGNFRADSNVGDPDDATISVATGDLDEDGTVDLLLANRDGQANRVLLARPQDRRPAFVSGVTLGSTEVDSRAVALGDMNGDGHLDMVMTQIGAANRLFLGDGKGGHTDVVDFGASDGATYCLGLADLSGDGSLDIVVGNAGQPNRVFFNDGSGKQFHSSEFGDDELTYGLALGDLDGDGFIDVGVANSGSHNRVYWNRVTEAQ